MQIIIHQQLIDADQRNGTNLLCISILIDTSECRILCPLHQRYFGYREFARIAGISPQRLSELIKQGIVRTNEGGMVPESEIGYFIRERLGKELASSGHSYLYLSVGKSDEKLEALRI